MTKDWTTPEGLAELEVINKIEGCTCDIWNESFCCCTCNAGQTYKDAVNEAIPQLITKIREQSEFIEIANASKWFDEFRDLKKNLETANATITELRETIGKANRFLNFIPCGIDSIDERVKAEFQSVGILFDKALSPIAKIREQAARIEELEGHAIETGLNCIDIADRQFKILERKVKSRDEKVKTLKAKIKELEATCAKNTHNQCQDPKHLAAVELADSVEYDNPFSLDYCAYERYQQLKTQEDGE